MSYEELKARRWQTPGGKPINPIRYAAEVLRESAKQHRLADDYAHAALCEKALSGIRHLA